ncbi:g3660 [Coccomyxa viridis]|uniref:G3660 protein n=1 Tax=Coccomyxa viridis TaxID=1274662 RepID=A0ABP1FNB4_9CHLO
MAQVKVKGARKIGFGEFEKALEQVAAKKGIGMDELKEKLCANEGPKVQATQPDFVKFHDDKSTYTGVYANGGPTNVDDKGDLASLCDRSPADNRGVKTNS